MATTAAAGGRRTRAPGRATQTSPHLVDHGRAGFPADPAAFERFYRRLAPAAYSLAYRICRSGALAEDVVQQAFTVAWRNAHQHDPLRGSPSSWVLGIVRLRGIDAVRSLGRHERRWTDDRHLNEVHADADEPVQLAIAGERATAIRGMLLALPDPQRQVIELAYFDGLSQSEIADHLGIALGTVKGRMRLAMVKLRDGIAWS